MRWSCWGHWAQRRRASSWAATWYRRSLDIRPCSPAGITVQQSSSNRLALGIGLSHKPVIETGFGLSFSHPIRHLREYLTVLTPLLAGRAVQMSGQHYRVQQEPSVPPGVKPPPLLVAALGPQMLRLAGELADGTALGAQPWT